MSILAIIISLLAIGAAWFIYQNYHELPGKLKDASEKYYNISSEIRQITSNNRDLTEKNKSISTESNLLKKKVIELETEIRILKNNFENEKNNLILTHNSETRIKVLEKNTEIETIKIMHENEVMNLKSQIDFEKDKFKSSELQCELLRQTLKKYGLSIYDIYTDVEVQIKIWRQAIKDAKIEQLLNDLEHFFQHDKSSENFNLILSLKHKYTSLRHNTSHETISKEEGSIILNIIVKTALELITSIEKINRPTMHSTATAAKA